MVWLLIALVSGVVLAGGMSALVFRAHHEWTWTKPKKACVTCEVPRAPLDLIPVVGDLAMRLRCRSCSASVAWQYPVIELTIVALTVFHAARYALGFWVDPVASDVVWWYAARDIAFSLFLLTVFVYDFNYKLILDRVTIPAMVVALVWNIALGYSGYELVFAMVLLFLFFLLQYVFSRGRILGAGDVRMGLVIGAMLGLAHGLGAVLLAYVLGAVVGGVLLLGGAKQLHDRVPFGTFLAVAAFAMLVWGNWIIDLVV